jgi:hypothetical protein
VSRAHYHHRRDGKELQGERMARARTPKVSGAEDAIPVQPTVIVKIDDAGRYQDGDSPPSDAAKARSKLLE